MFKQGDWVSINGNGDLMMTHKGWVNHVVVFEKVCKSGLIMVSRIGNPKETTTVPKRNIDGV